MLPLLHMAGSRSAKFRSLTFAQTKTVFGSLMTNGWTLCMWGNEGVEIRIQEDGKLT